MTVKKIKELKPDITAFISLNTLRIDPNVENFDN